MWSDDLTSKIQKAKKLFDLECGEDARKDIPIAEAVRIAAEGGIENAQSKLDEAFTDQYCIVIQRPGKPLEMLVPHNWDT